MKILFAVITCNRFLYLKNCLNSILEFVHHPSIEILVIDNCTIDSGIGDYLTSVQDMVKVKRFDSRVPNELYRAMNFAINYARENGFPIVNFIQDDYQFLWDNPHMIDDVVHIFENYKKVAQVHVNFLWKRKWNISKSDYKMVSSREHKFAIFNSESIRMSDNGFTRVSVYDKELYPTKTISYDQNYKTTKGFGKNRYNRRKQWPGEVWFASKCRKMGLSRAIYTVPNLGMMFSCCYVRGTKRFGKYFPPPNKYYIKTFDEGKIDKVRICGEKNRFLFIEDYLQPDGWEPAGPGKHDIYSGVEVDI